MMISIHKTLTVMKLTVWFWWFLTIIPSIDCTSCCEYSARNFRKSFHNVQYPMYNFICYFRLFTRVKCVYSLLGLVASHVRKGSCLSALFFGLPTWQSCNTMHVFLILWFSFILYFRWWEIGGQCLQWNSVSKYFNSPRSEAPLSHLLLHEQIMCSTLLRWNKHMSDTPKMYNITNRPGYTARYKRAHLSEHQIWKLTIRSTVAKSKHACCCIFSQGNPIQ